jgi:hypothetical protein
MSTLMGKFTAGVVDTGGKFSAAINNTSGTVGNLLPVSLIPVANYLDSGCEIDIQNFTVYAPTK